jgi:predicted oxidoreductase
MDEGLVDSGQREIGESFLIGPVGYGCWRLDPTSVEHADRLVQTALDSGINFIDTADVYGTGANGSGFGSAEATLGKVLGAHPSLRGRMVLATKAGIVPGVPYDSSSRHLREACEASLRRLHTDRIDLFQIHRPDLFTHPGEVADALVTLHEQGKIREIGVSNFSPAQVMALQAHLPLELVTTQPEYSAARLGALRDGTLDQAIELGLTTLAWSPLAGGRLATGDGVRPELMSVIDELVKREEVDRSAIALAFVLAHPASPVTLVGTQQPERIVRSLAALQVHLERVDVYRIIEASEGAALP